MTESEDEEQMLLDQSTQHASDCRGREVVRLNRSSGHHFVGCSRWPDCRWTRHYSYLLDTMKEKP